MTRVEQIALLAGFAVVVLAVTAFDWRLGLLTLGLGLMASTFDDRRRA